MNFDDAFKHYRDGVATDEEKQFVKDQLAKVNEFLQNETFRDESPVKEADAKEVKQAKKKLKWQYIVLPICFFVCMLAIIAAILGGVFGSAASYAKQSAMYSRSTCVDIAKTKAFEFVSDSANFSYVNVQSKDDFVVDDVDADFNYNGKNLKNSYYTYIVELEVESCDFEINIEVDTRNGDSKVIKVK